MLGMLVVVLTLCGYWLMSMQRPRPLLARASATLAFERPLQWSLIALNDGIPVVATRSDRNWLVKPAVYLS